MKKILILFLLCFSQFCFSQKISTKALNEYKGNWYSCDAQKEWIIGIYDSLLIFDNKIFDYESIKIDSESIFISLVCQYEKETITITSGENHTLTISSTKRPKQLCSQNNEKKIRGYGNDEQFDPENFFREDCVCIRGYLFNYNSQDKQLIQVDHNNIFINEPRHSLIKIEPDGRFETTILVNNPTFHEFKINNVRVPFYAEPGDTIVLYIDYDEITGREKGFDNQHYKESDYNDLRKGNRILKRIQYMGNNSYINRELNFDWINRDWKEFDAYEAGKRVNSVDFIKEIDSYYPLIEAETENYIRENNIKGKAEKILRNNLILDYNLKFFLYNSCRWFSLISANDNKFAQEPLESTFFDCLKKLPYKDISILASYKISNLFNEIECSPVFDTEEFYKEENDKITNMNATFIGKNSMIKKFYGLSQLPLFFEIYNIRSFDFDLMSLDNPQEATIYYKDFINQIKNPVVKKRADNIYNNYFGDITDYVEIPESKNKEILNSILDKYKGKYVLAVFWGTYCGPCRAEIEAEGWICEKYKDNKNVQIIFITSERDSSREIYEKYIAKNIRHNDCYFLSKEEMALLEEALNFNTLPSHRTFTREGNPLKRGMSLDNIEYYLNKYLEEEKSQTQANNSKNAE